MSKTKIQIPAKQKKASSADKQEAMAALQEKRGAQQEQIREFAFGQQIGMAAKPKYESAYAFAEATMKKPTKKMARDLRIGDLIEVFYTDVAEPSVEVVIDRCERDEDIYRVRTVPKDVWNGGNKRPSQSTGPRYVNSDFWRHIGRVTIA